jgi:hypothetical protein
MPRVLRSGNFWLGVAVGVIAGPIVLSKVAPGLKAKIPSAG